MRFLRSTVASLGGGVRREKKESRGVQIEGEERRERKAVIF